MGERAWGALVGEGIVEERVPLASLTTAKVGGPARWLARLSSRASLDAIGSAYRADPLPVLVLGRGSNIVVSDSGFDGVVIVLGGEYARIELLADRIRAGGAVALPVLAREAVATGRLGLEFYVGIPGSVGGAVHQNAGGHGDETASHLLAAEVVDLSAGRPRWVPSAELDLGYRRSALSRLDVVLTADFSFQDGDTRRGERRLREITRWRRLHQPGGTRNAGSIFKNPPGDSAGRLVEECGLKGLAVGGVSISTRHANFFEAEPSASASDVARLVAVVRRRVAEASGIVLEPEILFVGDFGEELEWTPA